MHNDRLCFVPDDHPGAPKGALDGDHGSNILPRRMIPQNEKIHVKEEDSNSREGGFMLGECWPLWTPQFAILQPDGRSGGFDGVILGPSLKLIFR